MSYIEIPLRERELRPLTIHERAQSEVWTGAYYRRLTPAEIFNGLVCEPTMRLESGSETP